MIPHYQLNKVKFTQTLFKKGYKNAAEFTKKHHINRSTLNHYLKGKGPLLDSYYEICHYLDVDPLFLLSPVNPLDAISHYDEIKPIIEEIVKTNSLLAVGLFGSRAKRSAKKFSDWDLGLTAGKQNLKPQEYYRLKDLIQNLSEDLPRSVDVIYLDEAPIWFFEEMDYDPLFLAGNRQSWNFFLGMKHGIQKKQKAK